MSEMSGWLAGGVWFGIGCMSKKKSMKTGIFEKNQKNRWGKLISIFDELSKYQIFEKKNFEKNLGIGNMSFLSRGVLGVVARFWASG